MSNLRIRDPLDDFADEDFRRMKYMETLPKCDCCGEPIQSETYHRIGFAGMAFNVCDSCLEDWKVWREEFEDD